eukprot:CAMPEP_0202867472 /NCGR_PEP_ID=MMETSP1391-20130828/9455_1 /ASSEMBLY_ACC=CAM_ASM_000867 /TAXON_ID=1034604 /ORGANISM="Chlamydomonas leiostraca, Strain SAG 11-49" /LENGTH=352 /DNA_ID=CAMNT_0049547519 /DNA_START=24 /DNA_END=1078 /DNA_ORIENTATION=-
MQGTMQVQRCSQLQGWSPSARPSRRVMCTRAQATSSQTALGVLPNPGNPVLMSVVQALFSFPPLFNMARKNARNMIVKRAESMGLDWNGAMKEMQAQDWPALLKAVTNPAVQYPSYYTKSFHAYTEGNLCLEAALEVTMAAKSVHAMVMDPESKKVDPEGDAQLRAAYGKRLHENMADLGVDRSKIKDVVDIGCATGLSSLALMDAFPGARVTGIDLSPHFLAVGQWEQRKREAATGKKEALTFVHGAGEATGLPDASQDVVSMCLVCHELPQSASRAIFREAWRILRPGGCLCIMEMNPTTPAFLRIMNNPFAYTAFKSTEPWLEEYITFDMHGAMQEIGFRGPVQRNNTP